MEPVKMVKQGITRTVNNERKMRQLEHLGFRRMAKKAPAKKAVEK